VLYPLARMCRQGIVINIALGYFNLFPLPPLDGSQILAGLLPRRQADSFLSLSRYGFVILMLLAISGILGKILFPLVQGTDNFLFALFWRT